MASEVDTDKPDDPFRGLSPERHMVTGSAWMVGMRMSVRLIGLFSTLILARLLLPQDFGLVAMAMLIIGLVQALTDAGLPMAVVRHPNPTREHYDAAWTGNILVGFAIFGIINLMAHPAVAWFGDERVEHLLRLLAFAPLITSLTNIGVADFQRGLDFARDFRFFTTAKLIAFVMNVGLAFWLQSYWALAIGTVAAQTVFVILSYVMHPYRPRLSLKRFRELWSFSGWVLVGSMGEFGSMNVDRLFIGRTHTAADLGLYTVVSEVSMMILSELIVPVSRAMFPIFSKMTADVRELGRSFCRVLEALAYLTFPAGIGLAVVSDDALRVLYGAKWTQAAPFFYWLSLAAMAHVLTTCALTVLTSLGRSRDTAILVQVRFVMTLVSTGWLAFHSTPVAVAEARFIVNILIVVAAFAVCARVLELPLSMLVRAHIRPLVAALGMGFAVTAFQAHFIEIDVLRLFVRMAFGGVLFVGLAFVLWRLSGRPEGPEAMVLAALGRLRPKSAS